MQRRIVILPMIAILVAACGGTGTAGTQPSSLPSHSPTEAAASPSPVAPTSSAGPSASSSAAPSGSPAPQVGTAEPQFADFAPPISYLPDARPGGGVLGIIPKWVIAFNDKGWAAPVAAAVYPTPATMGGITMYRFPDANGQPSYTTTNPFKVGFDPSKIGQDPLTYVGLNGKADVKAKVPKGAQMVALLEVIASEDSGTQHFYWDGQYLTCKWTGGASKAPAYGVARASVKPTCTEDTAAD